MSPEPDWHAAVYSMQLTPLWVALVVVLVVGALELWRAGGRRR